MHPNANLIPFTWPKLLPKIDFYSPTWTGLFQTHQLSFQVVLNAISSFWWTNVTQALLKTFMFNRNCLSYLQQRPWLLRTIIPPGGKQWMVLMLKTSGKLLRLKSIPSRKSTHGLLFPIQMILPASCLPPGHSKSSDTQMVLSRRLRDVSVLVETSKFKVLTSLKPTAQ